MKCSFILSLVYSTLIGVLYAHPVTGQDLNQKLDLKLKGTGIKESLLLIEGKSNIRFMLPQKVLDKAPKKVTLDAKSITVAEAINKILSNSGLKYSLLNNYVLIEAIPAQQRITGKVVDASTKETLPGVSVRIKGAQGGTTTDINGNFSLSTSEPKITLVFSYMGYNTREVAADKNSVNITVSLAPSSTALTEVTVQARRRTNTEVAVLDERKKSAIVQDAISALQIERTGSITTTQALQRVSGVTVTDDKYVAIRGLGDRSVVGQLNGIRLASSDPDRSSIPLDLVPASLLDNVTIYKTVTPDKPADAAAGIVELKTKSVPDSMVVDFVMQSGFNSNIGIGGQHNSFYNSDMGFLGKNINKKNLSADFLNLAQQYKGGATQIQKMIANSDYNPAIKAEVNRINGIMQRFDPVLTTGYKQTPLNQLYSLSFGNSYTVFKKHKLGVIAGANYYRRTTDVSGGDILQYSIYQGVVTGNPQIKSPRNIPNYITPNSLFMGKYQTYKENTGTETLNYGTLLGLTYRFNPQHEISMQYLGSWGGETQASNMRGSYEYTDLPGDVNSTIYSLRQSYRKLNTFNLQGEHKFLKGEYSPRLSYNVASSRAGQNDPDYRYANLIDYTPNGGAYIEIPNSNGTTTPGAYTKHLYALSSGYVNGFGPYGIIQAEPNGRRFRNLDEKNYNYKADVTLPFKLFGKKQEFKTGVNYLNRDREFTENVLFLPGSNFAPLTVMPLYTVEGNLNRLVSNEIIGIRPPTTDGEGVGALGGFIYNSQKSPNNYTGFFETKAGYAMMDLKLTEDLRVTGGLRFESTNIQSAVDTSGVFLDPSLTTSGGGGTQIPLSLTTPNSVYKVGYKPYYSLNATYNYKENMNFRAGYNTTLARPELREITNVFEFDAFQMGLVVGNPNLINQSTQNLDFRWEWFPNPGEVIAVSLFGKRIKNQLYKVFNLQTSGLASTYPEYPTIRFENDPNIGKVWGVEVEIVKDLGRIWDPLRNFFVGSNLLLAQSEIKKSPERLKANRSLDRHAPVNSPLFEQAPYSINGWLNYDNKRSGTSLTGTFNMVGERLIQINLTGEPDLYTRPVPVLDFVFSQRIVKRVTFKGYAKNILNPAIKTVYANPGTGGSWYGNEYINRSYKRGAEIMMGFTYNLY
ncbi:carboxypeptidase-like regulatory domain-containing protein [Pedobacter sp. AW31-3R]|uniref:TonB-dependent receptor n=1 Tax=Pedobacter sp. AW31-3R TaxID=3445781 RepID=UPI003F9F0919